MYRAFDPQSEMYRDFDLQAKSIGAETLLGRNNPAGRLPITFYQSLDDMPPFTEYSVHHRTYRYYTGAPLFSFGYGLSYTKFAYAKVKLSAAKLHAGDTLTAQVDVTNKGAVSGDQVVQVCLTAPAGGNHGLSPRLQLEGFQRVTLAAGETRTRLTFWSSSNLFARRRI